MKVCFETYGCRLNKAEALQMEADYISRGWELAEKHSDADLFIVRGCSVTGRAQAECEQMIAHLRHRYPTTPIQICGCLKPDKDTPLMPVFNRGANDGAHSDAVPTRTARAYLKVQDGCSGKCTFCIVPKFRGQSVSIPFTEVMDKAKRFIGAGYHELVVTGCNLSLYASEGKRLPELLASLAETDPGCRIRLGSIEPGFCAIETVHAIAEHANICRFLHIPVQSGSVRMLMAMKRPYSVRDIETLVSTAVKELPDLGLGCDMMTGFPDESALDFASTKGLLMRHPFNNIHAFTYSERPGTLAAAFSGSVPRDVRSSRAHELARIAQGKRKKFAESFIGKTVEILVESEDKKTVRGWTGEYLKCEVSGYAPRKSIARVIVSRCDGDRLYGRLRLESPHKHF